MAKIEHFSRATGDTLLIEPLSGWAIRDAGDGEDQFGYTLSTDNDGESDEASQINFTLAELRKMVAEAEALSGTPNDNFDCCPTLIDDDSSVTSDAAFQFAFDRLQAAADAIDIGASATNVQLADTAIRLGSTLALQGR